MIVFDIHTNIKYIYVTVFGVIVNRNLSLIAAAIASISESGLSVGVNNEKRNVELKTYAFDIKV